MRDTAFCAFASKTLGAGKISLMIALIIIKEFYEKDDLFKLSVRFTTGAFGSSRDYQLWLC
jgi:hypothetical protein